MKRNELTGQRFGRLVVTGVHGLTLRKEVVWACTCDCGGTARVLAWDLRSGRQKSCGCLQCEHRPRTHGQAGAAARRNPTYSVWATMKQRCSNPRDRNYPNYGGRGIRVCARWKKFENFYADMGDKPPGYSLERRDNEKGYNPQNCYWAPREQQARNTRRNVFVRYQGARMLLADALRAVGKTGGSLHYYMRTYGKTHQEVFDEFYA